MSDACPALTYDQFLALEPFEDRRDVMVAALGGPEGWGARPVTASEAVAAGATLEDLAWAAAAMAKRDPDVERRLRLWAADCTARVAPIANDARCDAAIVAARRRARGEIGKAAWDAAWDAARAAARAAARDAAWAAAWGAARDAEEAWDAAWAAAWDAAWDAEEAWQLERLCLWLSEHEPEDWPIRSAQNVEAAR